MSRLPSARSNSALGKLRKARAPRGPAPRAPIASLLLASAFAFLIPLAGPGSAQPVQEQLWSTNGEVETMVLHGGTLYVGGRFTEVGPATGGGIPLDATSGLPLASFPGVNGEVYAVAPDGTGGWFIGGEFTHVGGLPRNNLAWVTSDLEVADWNPDVSGNVNALAVYAGKVYVGGEITSVGGHPRNGLASVFFPTGGPTSWAPILNAPALAMAVSGTSLYVGGDFTLIDYAGAGRLVKFSAQTGERLAWDPGADARVYALAASGSALFAGGDFTFIGGAARNRIAALSFTTAAATSFDPNADGRVYALAVSGSTVYAGGEFTFIGSAARPRLAALSATTGAATAWFPVPDDRVLALAVSGTTVYAGGDFTSVGAAERSRIAALSTTTGLATAWDPHMCDRVRAVRVSGSTVYAGGAFSCAGGPTRHYIAAFDPVSGGVTPWNPDANYHVLALVARGGTLYAAGSFTAIGGQTRNRIAALDTTTGTATSWNPGANNWVQALVVDGSTIYAGGYFTSIGGQTRGRIAALDATTGLATSWNPGADSTVRTLLKDGSTIYAGGDFTSIGGQPRNRIAALDDQTGAATAWNPDGNGYVSALAIRGATVYAGGDFTQIGGEARDHVAALDATTGAATGWDPGAGGPIYAFALDGPTMYAAGSFVSAGSDVAELDLAGGSLLEWSPALSGVVHAVNALVLEGSRVYLGGAFRGVNALPRSGLAGIAMSPVILELQPQSGGAGGVTTVTVAGNHLRSDTWVMLSRAGQPDITATDVTVTPDGLGLTATFDLTGAAPGPWDFVLTAPDAQTTKRVGGFTVEPLEAPLVLVDVLGPAMIRGNHRTAFDLVIQNPGNTDALAVPLWIAGIPAGAAIETDFDLAFPPRDPGEPDWSEAPLGFEAPSGRYVALVIPRVPPGVTTRRIHLTVPASVSSFPLVVALAPPWADTPTFRACLADGGAIADTACMGDRLAALDAFVAAHPELAALSGAAMWAKIAWQCEGAASLPAALVEAEQALDYMVRPVTQEGAVAPGCGEVLAPRWRDALTVSVVTAVDPNEKVGPHGVIAGQRILPYTIRFENLATSGAPAQNVYVIDALDPATLEAGSLSLGQIAFGDVRLDPPPGMKSYATRVDLRPVRDLLVDVGAAFDGATGVLSWYFISIDPETGQPPTDPLVGFLPPNVIPGEGEGSVQFSVTSRPGLASGTQIGNRAAITFDDPPEVWTENWLNTVDNTPPASAVLPLPPYQDSVRFTIGWEAVPAPDLRDFTVYVAEDGGPYRAWRLCTETLADTFTCRGNHAYAFYSVARDLSGNVEAAPESPDAQTFARLADVTPAASPLTLMGARPNPASGAIHAWFALPAREPATLELIDVTGRRVARREVGSLGPGAHVVALGDSPRIRPGLYFLRLTQGRQTLQARVALVW